VSNNLRRDIRSFWLGAILFATAALAPIVLLTSSLKKAEAQANYAYCGAVSGMTGCYDCMVSPPGKSPGGTGCNGVTTPPAGFSVGMCASNGWYWQSCTAGFINCGAGENCGPPIALNGATCATLSTCK